MLSSFWRRKNGRLVERLNAAIEASERLSEAYNAPKPPRVAIDTSYVERRHRSPTIAHQPHEPHDPQEYAAGDQPVYGEEPAHTDGPGADGAQALYDDFSGEDVGAPAYDGGPDGPRHEQHAGDIELIREAVEQLELAEQREAKALAELEAARRRAEELEAAIASEKEARQTAEAQVQEARDAAKSAAEELNLLRANPPAAADDKVQETTARAKLEAQLMLERAARREAEAQHEKVRVSLDEAQQEIDVLRRTAEELAAAKAAAGEVTVDDASHAELEELRTKCAALETDAAEARAELQKAQSEAKAARRAAEAAGKDLAALRQASEQAEQAQSELSEAVAREKQALADAESLRTQIADLNARLADAEKEHDAERQSAKKAASEAAEEIAALRLAAEHLAGERAKQDFEDNQRYENARKQVEVLEAQVREREAALEAERESARTAAAQATEEIEALRASVREIAESQSLVDSDAERRIAEVLEQVEALRTRNSDLEAEKARVNDEAQKAVAAAAAAASEIEALRSAAEETQTAKAEIEELRTQLQKLQERAEGLEQALDEAEAARLSAEFDRDNALKDAAEAATRLAAQRRQASSSPRIVETADDTLADGHDQHAPADAWDASSDATASATPAPEGDADAGEEPGADSNVVDLDSQRSDPAGNTQAADATAEPNTDEEDQTAPSDTASSIVPPPLPAAHQASAESHADDTQVEESAAANGMVPTAPVTTNLTVYSTSAPDASNQSERRGREKRVPSQMPVTLWREEWGQPLSCFLADKSSRGAKIEMRPDRIFGGNNRINVGDRLTLTFYYAHERTSVFCDVMWMNGNFLGVKYYGQFHTEFNKPRTNQRRRFGAAE